MEISILIVGIVALMMSYFFYINRNKPNKSSFIYKKLGDKSSKRLMKIIYLMEAIIGIIIIILSFF